ncbi:MAG: hypothetical protein IJ335_03655 [Lachnospiraceae bacterium]|nr:hypothetical protein [Lachnospiraceae bacterium]
MWNAMVAFFERDKIFTTLMLVALVAGLVIRIGLGLAYGRLIGEADNMATTNHPVLRQWKGKYENCYQMNKGVSNTAIFVDKLISRLSWGPFSYGQWYLLSAQAVLLSVLSAGVGICINIAKGATLSMILPYYIVVFGGLYLFFSVTTSVDIRERKRVLKVNMVDYLENHLSPRIQITREDMDFLYGDKQDEDYELIERPASQKDRRAVEWKKKDTVSKGSLRESITYDELEQMLRELLAT